MDSALEKEVQSRDIFWKLGGWNGWNWMYVWDMVYDDDGLYFVYYKCKAMFFLLYTKATQRLNIIFFSLLQQSILIKSMVGTYNILYYFVYFVSFYNIHNSHFDNQVVFPIHPLPCPATEPTLVLDSLLIVITIFQYAVPFFLIYLNLKNMFFILNYQHYFCEKGVNEKIED